MKRVPLLALLALCANAQYIPGGGSSTGGGDPCSAAVSAVPSGLHCNTITATAADLRNSAATPIVLVAAPGAGNVVFPFAFRWKLAYNSHPYYMGPDTGPYIWWQNFDNAFSSINWGGLPAGLGSMNIVGVTSTTAFFGGGASTSAAADPAAYTNQPLVLQGSEGNSLNRGPLLTLTPSAPGSGYAVGDLLTFTSSDAVGRVSSIGAAGAVTGTSITTPGTETISGNGQATFNVGNVTSATVTMGHAGLLYANGDTGTVSGCGNADATYTVLTSSGGAVSTVSIAGGTIYTTMSGCATTPTTGTGNGALELNVVAGGGSGLTVNATVQAGDSTLTVTTWYTIAAE